jgi:hypothetical protein
MKPGIERIELGELETLECSDVHFISDIRVCSRDSLALPVLWTQKSEVLLALRGSLEQHEAAGLSTAIAARLEGTGPTIRAAEGATGAAHFFLRLRFVHGELTTIEIDAVHLFDGQLALRFARERDERETARAARHAIVRDVNVGDGAELTECVTEDVFGGVE